MIMSGNIFLVAPGGRPGDIFLDIRNPSISNYVFTGRVVATDGTPRDGLTITVFERRNLVDDVVLVTTTTDARGGYRAEFSLPSSTGWDVFVRAEDEEEDESVDSVLLSDLEAGTHTVDLVLGTATYQGRSEWDRIAAKLERLLGETDPKNVPASRLEWLAKRADVFPLHLAAYVQAHRLADGRSVKPESCYAFLRAGLPADLPGILRAGEAAWASALRNAWVRRVLTVPGSGTPSEIDLEVATEIAAMHMLVVDAAVAETGVNQQAFLAALGLSEAEQREFTQMWLEHTGTTDEFWQDVRDSPALGTSKADDLQFAIQAALLADHCVSAVEALAAERTATTIPTIADTAVWDYAAWDAMLVARSVTPPDHVPGANATEKRQNFARALERAADDAFPTLSLRHRIDQDLSPPPNTTELVDFLDANVGFDIVETNIDRWVADNPTAFSGATDPEEARENLEIVQRLYRLVPRIGRYSTVKTLLANGVRSAADVCEYTRDEFVDAFGSLFDGVHHTASALAGRVWDRASRIHGSAQAMASYLGLAKTRADSVPLGGLGDWGFDGAGNGLSSLASILGSLDYCACEHCRSVFSPAAYLADLLHFLSARPAEEGNGLDALIDRRPDIPHIDLDCTNTNTVLPYIDLVNECLEQTFAGGLGASSHQTTWTAEELSLHPEHLDADIYEGTAAGVDAQITEIVHPWVLPFFLPELETREMLAYLGVPRHRLMTLLRDDNAVPVVPTANAIVAERLGMSAVERTIIAGDYDNASEDDREFYGYADGPSTDGWVAGLAADIGNLLERGDYTLDGLRDLLSLTFVDPDHYDLEDKIAFLWDESCELAEASINNLTAAALDRLHRFTRLQRRTGIPARTLNVLIDDVGASTLDETFLSKLADILVLQQRFGLAYDEFATWWATRIDARKYADGQPSLYHRRFLPPGGEAPAGFLPTTDRGDVLAGQTFPSAAAMNPEELPTVLAASRLSQADFDLLLGATIVSNLFSFANFTRIFAAASLARALKLTIADFVQFRQLTGIDPFSSPSTTLEFVEALDALRRSRFELAELNWVLRHVGEPAIDDATHGLTLAELSRGLATIESEVAELVDPTGAAVRANLESVVSNITVAMAIVDGSTGLSESEQEDIIEAEFASFVDPVEAMDQLVTGGGELGEDLVARYNWVLRAFTGSRRKRALLIDTATSAFEISASVAEALIYGLLSKPGTSDGLATDFADSFASEAQISTGLTPASHAVQFASWRRLEKAALVARRHAITAEQLPFYSGHLSGDWLDLDDLPLADADDDASFEAWLRLTRALDLRPIFGNAQVGHQEVAGAVTFAAALERLAELTDWPLDELQSFTTNIGWSATSVFDDENGLERLRDLFTASSRIGAGVDVLWTWVHGSLTLVKTGEIKAAARARAGEDRWPAVAKPIRDRLRMQQRDALVAAVLAQNPEQTRESLLNWLLIDIEMSCCMMTTRIVQAISSVQMFVHRILLQLESEVTFAPGAAAAWDWMKNYRVWEANRKVFLYPENWIEPQLRKDRSPEFDQFESALMQDTLDEPRIERAMVGYLTKLDRVANLEIAAIYQANPFAPLWMLARTQSAPRKWFLRKRNSRTNWVPWEELPLEISSDNVLLFERRGRVLLFWLTTVESEITPTIEIADTEVELPVKATRLAITWAERDHQGWSSSSMSASSAPIPTADLKSSDQFLLRGFLRDDGVYITVYRQRTSIAVQPSASFRYDVVSHHVMFCGQNFTKDDFPKYLNTGNNLANPLLIGLQPEYRIEGQRFAKRQLNEGSVPDVPQGGITDDNDLDPSTRFVQAQFSGTLFNRASNTGYRTLLHQGDFWSPDASKRFCPVVYDDRQRKYLLEPRDGVKGPGVEEDDLPPRALGGKPSRYYGCVDAAEVEQVLPRSPLSGAQRSRDSVRRRSVWPNGIPGSIDADELTLGIVGLNLAKASADAILAQGAQLMGGNAGVTDIAPALEPSGEVQVKMTTLYHPFARDMLEAVAQYGLDALYRPALTDDLFRQGLSREPLADTGLDVEEAILAGDAPIEEFDFEFSSPYGNYNWEVFYHIPMLIAGKLSDDQRFADAQRWFHTMFDPIETIDLPEETSASKFWRIRPFVEQAQNLAKDQFELMLGIGATPKQQADAIAAFENEVSEWRKNPFDPHAIARVRPGVYQRALLKAYFDNLIAWADHLFRQDTLESINEATILYVLVAQLLGPRPQAVPSAESTAKSFAELQAEGLDAFSNVAQKLENWILVPTDEAETLGCGTEERPPWVREKVEIRFWYFCYPPNPQLLAYWDTIADRLWKIRHCRNIEGVERTLAIFQPPIDPALLVQATAAGIDIASVLAELDSGLPPYRFRSVYARADGFCADLRNLGSALLQAIEKRDAEALARIRSEHELAMLDAVREIRQRQVDEAKTHLDSLRAARATIEDRRDYYQELFNGKISAGEQSALDFSFYAAIWRVASQGTLALASLLNLIPDFTISAGTDTSVKTTTGGNLIGSSVRGLGEGLGVFATLNDAVATRASTMAGYDRRERDWEFQVEQAEVELVRMDRDIAAAEIRVAIAERELANHELSVEQTRAVDQFMREKFTNRELYDWMIGQLSTLYFQTYQIAFDLAKRAERAYRHELAVESGAPIVKYGYWDSLRKGLLAGEKLGHDLKRLDLAYMDRDIREFELRKTISLADLDPHALHELRENGVCTFRIPELVYDLDHPGHYLRRIRAVRLTIPAVVGPYTSLGARLQLEEHRTRVELGGSYAESPVLGDTRFRYRSGAGQAIATSTAVQDGGVFNLDFRDERYLPFEYCGAISRWTLTLPDAVRQFDYRTISNVIVHIDYTARDGDSTFRSAAEGSLVTQFNALSGEQFPLLIAVHKAFPNEWQQFLTVPSSGTTQTLDLPLKLDHFPHFARRMGLEINNIRFLLLADPSITTAISMSALSFDTPVTTAVPIAMTQTETGVPYMEGAPEDPLGGIAPATYQLVHTKVTPAETLTDTDGWLSPDKVKGLLMLVEYTLD
jgi:hypothetical protein